MRRVRTLAISAVIALGVFAVLTTVWLARRIVGFVFRVVELAAIVLFTALVLYVTYHVLSGWSRAA